MAVFLVTPLSTNHELLRAAISSKFQAADFYELQAGAGWLVSAPGTTVEVSNHIGITGQAEGQPALLGSALVTNVSSYYGRGPTIMWEWIKTRLERA